MYSKIALARQLLEHYERLAQVGQPPLCFIGFDGFTDEIIRVVDQRLDTHAFQPLYTMTDFGKRILSHAGKTCNLELVPVETRVGGNAPLMAQALLQGGHRMILAGAIGHDNMVERIFQPLAARCQRVIPLSPSGHTDALEFYDGKVMLGKMGSLADVSYEALTARLPEEELRHIFETADLFASVNWTMLPNMNSLWKNVLERIVPHCSVRPAEKPRWMFVDLADTVNRRVSDVREALELLPAFQPTFRVTLGLDHSETQQIYQALIGHPLGPGPGQIEAMAKAIRKQTGVYQVLVHASRFASATSEESTARVEAAYCAEPKITTGGGTHFNAGFCNGLLYGLPLDACLLTGVATAGYYVRKAHSPSMSEIAAFLERWHTLGDRLDT